MKHIVLIVDDDIMIQKLHSMMVKRNEFAVDFFKFENGQLALDFILNYEKKQTFIVLLDINMPVMNGWAFLDALSQNQMESLIFVVIVSSSVDLADIEKAKTYPQVIAYFDKPLTNNTVQLLKTNPKIAHLFEGIQ